MHAAGYAGVMMRTAILGLVLLLVASTGALALDGWLPTREKGLEAASQSGKPVLVITLWGDGV